MNKLKLFVINRILHCTLVLPYLNNGILIWGDAGFLRTKLLNFNSKQEINILSLLFFFFKFNVLTVTEYVWFGNEHFHVWILHNRATVSTKIVKTTCMLIRYAPNSEKYVNVTACLFVCFFILFFNVVILENVFTTLS